MFYIYVAQNINNDGIRDIQLIYGNALISIMLKSQNILDIEDYINLFIMKHVLMKMMQGRENNI